MQNSISILSSMIAAVALDGMGGKDLSSDLQDRLIRTAEEEPGMNTIPGGLFADIQIAIRDGRYVVVMCSLLDALEDQIERWEGNNYPRTYEEWCK